ncbi:MAG: hypothetical protein U0800_12035 [Isosphaeraceae bacterium]
MPSSIATALTALYNPNVARDTLVAGNNVRGRSAEPEARPAQQPTARGERPITIPRPDARHLLAWPEVVTVGAAWRATPVSHPRSAEKGPWSSWNWSTTRDPRRRASPVGIGSTSTVRRSLDPAHRRRRRTGLGPRAVPRPGPCAGPLPARPDRRGPGRRRPPGRDD